MVNWHARFVQQAAWTRDLRVYLLKRAGLPRARRVLEVGCGTGAILAELSTRAAVHGLDLEPAHLSQAIIHAPGAFLTCGDAHALPYPPRTFDITFCHFLLLWVRDPQRTLSEMARVTRRGGYALAMAEPDYCQRIDHPPELALLGRWQTESLWRQGADPKIGSRLAALFAQAGIRLIETGTLRGREKRPLTLEERETEWAVLEADLAGFVPAEEIHKMRLRDAQAWERGERVLFVPTHYAWGQVV